MYVGRAQPLNRPTALATAVVVPAIVCVASRTGVVGANHAGRPVGMGRDTPPCVRSSGSRELPRAAHLRRFRWPGGTPVTTQWISGLEGVGVIDDQYQELAAGRNVLRDRCGPTVARLTPKCLS